MNLGALGKMVGPLPLGAWVATVGGAAGLTQVAKLRGKKKKSDPAPEPVYNAGALPFAPLQEPMWGGPVGLPSTAAVIPGPVAITNNTEWQRAAAADLAGRGYGAVAAGNALAKYLQGLDPLDPDELALVDAALRYTGYPPQPPSVAPPARPPSLPSPPPATVAAAPTPTIPTPALIPMTTYRFVRGAESLTLTLPTANGPLNLAGWTSSVVGTSMAPAASWSNLQVQTWRRGSDVITLYVPANSVSLPGWDKAA